MRPGARENAAIATLKILAGSQVQFQKATCLDRDGDGFGEFGTLRELGSVDSERLSRVMATPLISQGTIPKQPNGRINRSGYCVQLYLPRGEKGWVLPISSKLSDLDADAAETRFLIIAWPLEYGETGKRCFFVDETGRVRAAANDTWQYSGESKVPGPEIITLSGFVELS